MILTEDTYHNHYRIHAYQPGTITVNHTPYTHSLIITPDQLIPHWPPHSLENLTPEHLDILLALRSEIILLGTGIQFKMPTAAQLAPLYQQKRGVECMDTGAACRTYTVLASEGRHVIAALLIH